MSGGTPALALKDEDVTKFLASATHLGASNLDFQMASYVFKRRSDGESSKKSKKQAVDCRRSTAAQFFVEEVSTETVSPEEIVALLNDAIEPKEPQGTIRNLRIVKSLLLQEPRLLDSFLDEVVNFQHDPDVNVRRFVVQFIEDVCKQEPQTLPKVVGNLDLMLQDKSISVQKRVVQAMFFLFPVVIKWLSNAKKMDEIMIATWMSFSALKSKIFALLESENEGLRTMSVKLMEAVVIAQSAKDEYYELKDTEISLDDIPVIMKVFRPRKMEEEAQEVFQKIIDFHNASHVSGSNLMACMQVLTTIAKKRFQYFSKVLQAYETLHANMPPTLSQSQVTSVRKSLKLQLFILVKHPAAAEFHSQMSIMLSDLGATPIQISRCFPMGISTKKPPVKSDASPSKQLTDIKASQVAPKPAKQVTSTSSAIDVTAEDLKTKFSNENIADLVLVSMLNLPEIMPVQFQSTYTPIAAAGTDPQIQHLARLLATQMTALGIGKGAEMKVVVKDEDENSDEEDEVPNKQNRQIQTLINRTTDKKPKKEPLVLLPSGSAQPKAQRVSKKIDFHVNVKPLSKEESERFCRSAYKRILDAEKAVVKKGAGAIRTKILTTLATQMGYPVASDLREHILDNPRARLDLAFSWMYQEYASCKGFDGTIGRSIERYEEAVNQLLVGVTSDEPNSLLFYRFFMDLPCVTEGMANTLKQMSSKEKTTEQTFDVAKSMCLKRPPQKLLFLDVISDLTLHENEDVRGRAVDSAIEIYESGRMKSFVETFALRSLKFLLDPVPDPVNFVFFSKVPETWTDDLIKVCLNLYFALLPLNHSLINDLGTVYVETTPDVKRTILRALEVPVKKISMTSPELLRFVECCPQGAETFVTRIIHILTDKAPPSAELVAHVRDLYQKRVPDVRFLIPIINGLTKREVIAALPELIKLNPTVVKEVFHRLVGSNLSSPLSPAELLVALHNIDTKLCNLKTIIKATSLCFEEKQVYTQVVLAMVMQQLMEQNPLPILLMRTVIQSLAHHPHLLGFVTNILQRLILKEVWKQPKIWEGFIRCCQRTKPQSFQVLLQLPAPQLEEVLTSYPDLRDPLCQHVQGFTEHQKAHLPADVVQVLDSIQPIGSDETAENKPELMDVTVEPLPPGEDAV